MDFQSLKKGMKDVSRLGEWKDILLIKSEALM